jgi:hypothetical protein
MTRLKIGPLRALTDDERRALTQISRSASSLPSHVRLRKALLTVAGGLNHQVTTLANGQRGCDVVAHLVSLFNRESLAMIARRL